MYYKNKIAEGIENQITPINYSGRVAEGISVDYSLGNDHYYMTVAAMLHIVNLYRNHDIKPVEKIIDYLRWTYDNLLICQYDLAYAILLFTEQDHIKAPKGANTNDIERIVSGCENQAWDLSYLSNWSTIYWDKEKYSEEFMFSTNDILLKRIFINTHGPDAINGLLYEVFSRKDYDRILDYIEERQTNRIKPDFGSEPRIYFDDLIRKEKDHLIKMLSNSKEK